MINNKKIVRINKTNVKKFIRDLDLHNTENFIKNLSKVYYFGYKDSFNQYIFGGIVYDYNNKLEITVLFSANNIIKDIKYTSFINDIKKTYNQNINLEIYIKKDIHAILNNYKITNIKQKIKKSCYLRLKKIAKLQKPFIISSVNIILSNKSYCKNNA